MVWGGEWNDWGRRWNDWGRFWASQNRPQSSHNQKTTETYEIANYSARDVGKRCTVYEHDGKVIVDAVER